MRDINAYELEMQMYMKKKYIDVYEKDEDERYICI